MMELAYWDEPYDGLRVPVLFGVQDARTCVITRCAAQELSSMTKLTARECFGVARQYMRELSAIARNKVASRAPVPQRPVLIDRGDVVAARNQSH